MTLIASVMNRLCTIRASEEKGSAWVKETRSPWSPERANPEEEQPQAYASSEGAAMPFLRGALGPGDQRKSVVRHEFDGRVASPH